MKPPSIPGLKRGGWIDLDELGSDDLLTYIKWDGMKLGDVFWPNWRGCGAEGKVCDMADARKDVSAEDGYDPSLGMPVYILNSTFIDMDQGWAFYSYALGDESDPNKRGDESQRIFLYLGKRPPALLPIAQIKESHDLALDPDAVDTGGVTAVVPPYRAMSVGDKVTFEWQGYDKFGVPEDDAHTVEIDLIDKHLGQPLEFNVPRSEFNFIRGGHAQFSYKVEYANGQGPSDSQSQLVKIVAPTSPLLPEIKIKGHSSGPIDPGRFPKGLTLQIQPVPPGIQHGDGVLMYWMGAKSVIRSLQVDRSTLDSDVLEFHLEPEWLLGNVGGKVKVSYQYASVGASESGTPLTLDVRASQELPAPLVEGFTSEGLNRGWIEASTNGAYVVIPAAVTIGPDVRVEVHWMGHPHNGQVVVKEPVAGSPKRFKIPSTAIPSNMATALQPEKRFDVFYKLISSGESDGQPSDEAFNLRIEPTPTSLYPIVECEEAIGTGQVSLSALGPAGAAVRIGTGLFDLWPFVASGQLLTIEASGVAAVGGTLIEPVRTAVSVSSGEVRDKKITAQLALEYLKKLKLDQDFTLSAKVSFDGGESYRPLKSGNIRLIR
ncbi:hypothetical protein DM828_03005 [Pseudomonas umsongensis]|nr:hypothetical protein [Pseudomonas umsongensis]